MMTLLVLVTGAVLLERLNAVPRINLAREQTASELLRDARSGLLGFAVSHPDTPGRLPYPDRDGDDNWDGIADCWSNNVAATDINPELASGRLPWQGDVAGLTGCGGSPWRLDSAQPLERNGGLWYAVSRNLLFRESAADESTSRKN